MAARRRDRRNTPLGREYARLASWKTADPTLDAFPANRIVRADEAAVWTASVGRVKHALGPDKARSNPVVVGDLVLVATFSPGRVVAFDRHTGAKRWSRRLGYYGDPVTPGPVGLAVARTARELVAVSAATGRVAWTFRPYSHTGEMIYSRPTLADGRLFVGDRWGHLHCLDAVTGRPVWQVLTSRADNNDVNSDPVVAGGVVAVGTNARLAAGFDAATGRAVWRHRLDGPCTNAVPAGDGDALLWTSGSAYLLSVPDGALLRRWRRPGHAFDSACVVGGLTLTVTRRRWGTVGELWPVAELRAFRDDELVSTRPYRRWAGATLRFESATGRVYESTTHGLGILDPRTGERVAVVVAGDERYGQFAQPAAADGLLYAAVEDGRVFALPHP